MIPTKCLECGVLYPMQGHKRIAGFICSTCLANIIAEEPMRVPPKETFKPMRVPPKETFKPIERKINWQRCFKIPRKRLDHFLVKLQFSNNSLCYFEAEYVFIAEEPEFYDVVVNGFGLVQTYDSTEIEKFVEGISK